MQLRHDPALRSLLAALALASTTSLLSAQAACTVRNGSGTNPTGYACTSLPLIGTNWTTTVDVVGPGANFSVMQISIGGPLAGVPLSMGELLCAPPYLPFFLSATGDHSVFLPNDQALVGATLCTQAATLFVSVPEIVLQNAIDITIGQPGGADITVLVLTEDPSGLAPPTMLPGATVTLAGTDPASSAGLSGVTNAQGTVTFPGVTGPYRVTAQADFNLSGSQVRVASSLIDIAPVLSGQPATGTIGVLLFPEEDTNLATPHVLTGTVTNLPPLPFPQGLVVRASVNGPVEWEGLAFVDPVTGQYSMAVPANVTLDAYVAHVEDSNLWSPPVLATLFAPGIASTPPPVPSTNLTANFDFNSTAVVPWNLVVPFQAAGLLQPPGFEMNIQLIFEGLGTGEDYSLTFFEGASPPATVRLPDLANSHFNGYRKTLDVEGEVGLSGSDVYQAVSQIHTTTPPVLSLDFLSWPTLVAPSPGSFLFANQLPGLTIDIVEAPPGTSGQNGFNEFWLAAGSGSGGPTPPGIDGAYWAIWTHPGTASFDLPPAALPMFVPVQTLEASFGQVRLSGFVFDLDTLMGPNLAADWPVLLQSFTSVESSELDTSLVLLP